MDLNNDTKLHPWRGEPLHRHCAFVLASTTFHMTFPYLHYPAWAHAHRQQAQQALVLVAGKRVAHNDKATACQARAKVGRIEPAVRREQVASMSGWRCHRGTLMALECCCTASLALTHGQTFPDHPFNILKSTFLHTVKRMRHHPAGHAHHAGH